MNKLIAVVLLLLSQVAFSQPLVVGTQVIFGEDKTIREDGRRIENGNLPDFVRFSAGCSTCENDVPLTRIRADGSLVFNFYATVHFSKYSMINVAGPQMGYVMVWVGDRLALMPVFHPLTSVRSNAEEGSTR